MHAQPRVLQGGHAPQMAMPSHFPQPQLQPASRRRPAQPPQPVVHTHGQPVRAGSCGRRTGAPTSAQVVHPPPPSRRPPRAPAAEGGKGAAAQGTNGKNPTAAVPAGEGGRRRTNGSSRCADPNPNPNPNPNPTLNPQP